MGIFKVGDKVRSNGKFFDDKRVGRVVSVKNQGFLVYNVKYPGSSKIQEYHKGELNKVKYASKKESFRVGDRVILKNGEKGKITDMTGTNSFVIMIDDIGADEVDINDIKRKES